MYVLDTNTLIYFFKGMGNVAGNLLATAPRDIAIPAIVLCELEIGIEKSQAPQKRREQLASLVSLVQILPFGKAEAKAAAHIRARLEKLGHPIGPLDNLIAGTAFARQATLITHNVKEFQRIKGLAIQDWY